MSVWEPYFPFNKRTCPRFEVKEHATIYLDKNTKKGLKLEDISEEGVGGLIDSPIQVGETVEILLLYPFFAEPVKKKAKVCFCKEINKNTWKLGLNFGKDNKIDLTDYLKRIE